jgi:hypothetical protein
MTYQVYALKYAERDTKACEFFFREPSEEPLTLHFYARGRGSGSAFPSTTR